MAEYEKDYVLRIAKDMAKGLSAFLEDSSVDDILQVGDHKESQQKKEYTEKPKQEKEKNKDTNE